jgi:hypothetical protein
LFSLAEVIDVLNRDFICLRASRKSDGHAQGSVRELGFDWGSPYSNSLIRDLNANQSHLLREAGRSVAVRGRVVKLKPNEVPGLTDWSAGRLKSNYQFYLLTPRGKAIDLNFQQRDPHGAEYWKVCWTSRFVMPRLLGERSTPLSKRRIGWHVGKADQDMILKTLGKVSNMFPAKQDRLEVPWQTDASFAVRWAKRDQKRIVVVPAPGGRVDPALERLLSSPDVLRTFHRSFTYLKLDPAKAGKLRSTLEALKDGGVAVCDIPSAACAVEWRGEDHPLTKVVEAAAGPHTLESLTKLLRKHAVAPGAPTWTQLTKAQRVHKAR